VRKPRSRSVNNLGHSHSPFPQSFSRNPEALKREKSTNAQKNFAEGTIVYGDDDALPLRIAKLVQESPATTACLKTISQYIKGASFSDKELMKLKVNKYGLTLWDLHSQLSDILPIFEGFAVNFKYSGNQKITNAYILSFESCRFKKPQDDNDDDIKSIVYNPYFGTDQNEKRFSTEYCLYDIAQVKDQQHAQGNTYKGQVYYFGKTKPLYRFYPVPDYWSAKKWIEVDAKIQEFHAKNLSNGFFQSVLMNVIGDPHAWSKNPRTMREVTKDGQKKLEPTQTVGEEFNDKMSDSFSGSDKAGNVMVMWAHNKDTAINVQAFPTNTNADLFNALQDLTTKNITIATGVPGILANISEGVSLGSGGSEIQKAIELMQSRVTEWQNILMQFYNEVLLPNLEGFNTGSKVEILNFNPVSEKVELEDKFWEVLTPEEKRLFIGKNFTNIELVQVNQLQQPVPGQQNTPQQISNPNQDAIDTVIRNLTRRELLKLYAYVNDYKTGRATLEQTKIFLRAYKFTDEQIMIFLNDPEGDGEDDNTAKPIVP
jgi:hypothetical protein